MKPFGALREKWLWLMVLTVLLWGAWAILSKMVTEEMPESHALFVFTLGAVCSSASAPSEIQQADCDDTIGQQVTELVNEIRRGQGLAELAVDRRLVAAAQSHSEDMATHDFLSHEGSDGSDVGERLESAGYAWSFHSENVGGGYANAQAVVDGWMASAGHRANILSSNPEHLGVGYASAGGTQFVRYWTLDFGSTAGPAAAPARGCHP